MVRPGIAGAALLLASLGASGCHRHARGAVTPPRASKDSVGGVVAVMGTAFEQHLVLRTDTSSLELVATRNDSTALSRLGGVDVVLFGTQGPTAFAVSAFRVRGVDGAPVVDGVLVRDGARLLLRAASGTVALGNPPAAFDSLVGARLWVGGPLDTGPNVYGVIEPVE
jgi:hypothetical protein